MTKQSIRTWIKTQRENQSKEEIERASRQITEIIINLKVFKEASVIFLYAAFPKEIQTCYLHERARQEGKTIAYPKIEKMSRTMAFYSVADLETLERHNFKNMSINEPNPKVHPKIIPGNKDLMIVPGLAFDKEGQRVGYGAGFYDRYLKNYPKLYKVGVGMPFQLFETVPSDDFDIGLDRIIVGAE